MSNISLFHNVVNSSIIILSFREIVHIFAYVLSKSCAVDLSNAGKGQVCVKVLKVCLQCVKASSLEGSKMTVHVFR